MKTFGKKIFTLLTVMTLLVASTIGAFAAPGLGQTATGAYTNLIKFVKTPWTSASQIGGVSGNLSPDYMNNLQSKTYPVKDGGYYLYSELIGSTLAGNEIVDENKFNQLTTGSKQKFLQDVFKCANAYAYATEKGGSSMSAITNGANSETVGQLYTYLEGKDGMGSVLMASIMENTKPDFSSANKIYQPFSGVVGTILGLIAVVIMALLGITMALDIAYIVIPGVQLMLDGGEGGGTHTGGQPGMPGAGGGRGKGLSGLVSQAAKNAVQAAEGQGNQGQGGEGNKMAIGVYFKYRWLELVVLGICLLYLVSGNIYSFVAWILDLVSGFLGF
jgi:hypothetical protein